MQLIEAKIESLHQVLLAWDEPMPFAEVHILDHTIVNIEPIGDSHRLHLVEVNEEIQIRKPLTILWQDQKIIASTGDIMRSSWFDEHYAYDGPLGSEYETGKSTFRLWAPTAMEATLTLFLKEGTNGQSFPMQYEGQGVYAVTIEGDCIDMLYQYTVQFPNGMIHQTKDPYSLMDQGLYSKVVPVFDKVYPSRQDATHQILLPLSIPAFTGTNSGLAEMLQGKLQGLASHGTTNLNNEITGLDYLQWLSPTHLIIDDLSQNKNGEVMNAHMPNMDLLVSGIGEGAMEEVRGTLEQLHRANFNILASFDLSHVADPATHPLHLTVPGYYYRYDEQATIVDRLGVGDELATERYMVRKYIMNILETWLSLYQVDGFYLKNMTNFDEVTVQEIEQLKKPDGTKALIIGEGSDMLVPEGVQRNQASLYPNIEWTNPDFAWSLIDLAEASENSEAKVVGHMLGAFQTETRTTFISPLQVVHSLAPVTNLPMVALTMLIISQGQVLLPKIDQPIDWENGKMHSEEAKAYKDWIAFRKQEKLLQLEDYDAIHTQTQVLQLKDQVIVYAIRNEESSDLILINVGEQSQKVDIPTGDYILRSKNYIIPEHPHHLTVTDSLELEPNQMIILEGH